MLTTNEPGGSVVVCGSNHRQCVILRGPQGASLHAHTPSGRVARSATA